MKFIDSFFEKFSRKVVYNSSRRGVLNIIGKSIVGAAFTFPVLPVARAGNNSITIDDNDDITSCDYWRYCALDGFLCSCCGGTTTSCPPGTTPSPISWVGTCLNPKDGKSYLVSYHDCCGKTACNKCQCANEVRERPGYQISLHNDVNWCMANENSIFHCTTSVIIGLAKT